MPDDKEFSFPDAFGLPEDTWSSTRPLTLAELRMLDVSYAIRSKSRWWEKCQDKDIRANYKKEALGQELRNGHLTAAEADYLLDELSAYQKMREEDTGIQASCAAQIYESDTLIPPELNKRLKEWASKLENVPEAEKDWHPGSDGRVLDLVHPSLFCAVYGRTLAYPRGLEPKDKEAAAAVPLEMPDDVPVLAPRGCNSYQFCWIPTNFRVTSSTTSEALEYINNIDPANTDLVACIEDVVGRFSALFDRVLTDLHPSNRALIQRQRVLGRYKWTWDEDTDPEPRDYTLRDFDERYQSWEARRTLRCPTVPEEGYGGHDPSIRNVNYSIVGKVVQVIVKLASIHLTPEKPTYGGGSWHIEGMTNESIVASGIYYYDSENITESKLSFRTAIELGRGEYEQDDEAATLRVWGLDRTKKANQVLGNVKTIPNRCIAFPNIYQHQVSDFRLVDSTKPGHRKILALFLVDPNQSVPSTTEIPPQQAYLIRRALGSGPKSSLLNALPQELLDMVVEKVESLMTLEEAKAFRLELMDERTAFVGEQDASYFATDFNMCEH